MYRSKFIEKLIITIHKFFTFFCYFYKNLEDCQLVMAEEIFGTFIVVDCDKADDTYELFSTTSAFISWGICDHKLKIGSKIYRKLSERANFSLLPGFPKFTLLM